MVMNAFEDRPMTDQFTKYTKNVVFKESSYPSTKDLPTTSAAVELKKTNHFNSNNTNLTSINNHPIKSASRGSSNMTGISNSGPTSTIGTPLSLTNSNSLPKPVLISSFNTSKFNSSNTNLNNGMNNNTINSANINSNLNNLRNENNLIKNERIKSSSLARSVTMKYTKSHFENSNSLSGTANQQLLTYGSNTTNSNSNNNINGTFNYPFNQNRKAPSTSLQQQLVHNQKQQQLIIDLSNPKKELYNNLHRSTSINLGREKSSLSNYFSTLNSNSNQANASTNNRSHLGSNNSLINSSNGTLNLIPTNNQNVNNYHNTKLVKRQTSFNSRNGNNNSTYNFANDLNSSNLFQPANSTGTGRAYTPLSSNHNNNSLHQHSNTNIVNNNNKNSLSLDNVFTNLDLILSNDTYLSSKQTNTLQQQANFLNTYSYRSNAHQPTLLNGINNNNTAINNNGNNNNNIAPKKIDINHLNQYKTATITTINLLNNNYNPITVATLNNRTLSNDNNINATNANINNSTSNNILIRKRSQKMDLDTQEQQNVPQNHIAPPLAINLNSLNAESVDQIKQMMPNRLVDINKVNPALKNLTNTAKKNENELIIKKTSDEIKEAEIQVVKDNLNESQNEKDDNESFEKNPLQKEITDVENRQLNSGSNENNNNKNKELQSLPEDLPHETEINLNANESKKVLDSYMTNESKLNYTSINDIQKNRNINKQPVNASRSNSTYYNNLNTKNAPNSNGNGNYRLHKNSIDSSDQGSPLQQQQQQQQQQLQTMQRSIANNEINFKTNMPFGMEQVRGNQIKINNSGDDNASRFSHVTRDVNDSYAYTNVQQYIEENELMPPEKAQSIRKWIIKVNSWCDDWEKRTIELNIEDSV